MKTVKFFTFALLAGAVMLGCEKKNPPVVDGGDDNPQDQIDPISIPAPAAGKTTIAIYVPEETPRGAYLVGNFQDNKIEDDAAKFELVDGEERWYAVTIDYAADLKVKAIAYPSDSTVALAWAYQWGMNIDPEDPDCKVTEDHVILLDGAGVLAFENGGEVLLTKVADGGVAYLQVKEWKATPVIPDVPAETAWMRHPFDGKNWTWKEMTKTADATFTLAARYGQNGCNISETEGGAENWFEQIPTDDEIAKGDSVLFTFVSTKGNVGKVSMKLLAKNENPAVPTNSIVKAKLPAEWTNEITVWIWWDGKAGYSVTPTKEGDWYVVSPGEAVTGLKVIFRNGTGWDTGKSDEIVVGEVEQACYELTLKAPDKMDAAATAVDCE